MKLDFDKCIKDGVEQAMKECELTIGMTLKEAVEKQIPKKPIVHGFREGREVNTISFTCPICNKHIDRENFCKHCGQALDWGASQ